MSKVGIFDSGIGGLTVLKKLLEEYPDNNYTYIADEKYFPYGTKNKDELLKRSKIIIEYFKNNGINTIVIACNTLSSTVLKDLKKDYKDLKIIGVIKSTIDKALKYNNKNMLVLATPNTIDSKIYKTNIEKYSTNKVYEIKTPSLAKLIEDESPKLDKEVKNYINKYNNIDIIILGCTHYKLISDVIKKYTKSKIISSSDEVVNYLKLDNKDIGQVKIYTTKNNDNFSNKAKKIIDKQVQFLDI